VGDASFKGGEPAALLCCGGIFSTKRAGAIRRSPSSELSRIELLSNLSIPKDVIAQSGKPQLV
jgi:hypothetical protein